MRKFRDLLLVIIIAGLVAFLWWKWKHPGQPLGLQGGVATVAPPMSGTVASDTVPTAMISATTTMQTTTFAVMSTDTTGTAATQTTTSALPKHRMYEEYQKATSPKKH